MWHKVDSATINNVQVKHSHRYAENPLRVIVTTYPTYTYKYPHDVFIMARLIIEISCCVLKLYHIFISIVRLKLIQVSFQGIDGTSYFDDVKSISDLETSIFHLVFSFDDHVPEGLVIFDPAVGVIEKWGAEYFRRPDRGRLKKLWIFHLRGLKNSFIDRLWWGIIYNKCLWRIKLFTYIYILCIGVPIQSDLIYGSNSSS